MAEHDKWGASHYHPYWGVDPSGPPLSGGWSQGAYPQATTPLYDPSKTTLVQRIGQAVNGEYNAIRSYTELIRLAPNEEMRRIIRSIRRDERRHFRQFSALYAQYTGGQQPPLSEEPLPRSFREGVRESIPDELRDSRTYQRIAQSTDNPYIRWMFQNAAHDEQRHASWFSYILNAIRE